MKIYNLKENDRFLVDGKEYIFNGRMDGMYGKCTIVESDAPMLIHVGIDVIKIERSDDEN